MLNVFAVFVGGGLGSLARYFISVAISPIHWSFPLATLVANLLACCFLGWSTAHLETGTWLLFLGTGVCGGFSTFSTFSKETITLFQNGMIGVALFYLLTSIGFGLIGFLFGAYLAGGGD